MVSETLRSGKNGMPGPVEGAELPAPRYEIFSPQSGREVEKGPPQNTYDLHRPDKEYDTSPTARTQLRAQSNLWGYGDMGIRRCVDLSTYGHETITTYGTVTYGTVRSRNGNNDNENHSQ